MWPAFFIRVSPASRNAKPACTNMTSTAATITHTVETATSRSWSDTELHLLQAAAGAVVRDLPHRRRPADPVAALVPAPGRVDDRLEHGVHELVRDDEDEQRLRQEPRLEDAAAVLVRDAALAPVADRLDDRHA